MCFLSYFIGESPTYELTCTFIYIKNRMCKRHHYSEWESAVKSCQVLDSLKYVYRCRLCSDDVVKTHDVMKAITLL